MGMMVAAGAPNGGLDVSIVVVEIVVVTAEAKRALRRAIGAEQVGGDGHHAVMSRRAVRVDNPLGGGEPQWPEVGGFE
jgi:hypothetical protein